MQINQENKKFLILLQCKNQQDQQKYPPGTTLLYERKVMIPENTIYTNYKGTVRKET